MVQKIFVGNLSLNSTEEEIQKYFTQFDKIHSIQLIRDKTTGKSRGFCFIEIENPEDVIKKTDNKDFNGRNLRVTLARK